MTKRNFILTIRALPDRVPVEMRLRGVLKRLLRTYGFQVTQCRPTTDPKDSNAKPD